MMAAYFFPTPALSPAMLVPDPTRYSMRCNCITNPNGLAETGFFLSTMTYTTGVIQAVEL